MKMYKNIICGVVAVFLGVGCRTTPWVMKVESAPPGARIYTGSNTNNFLGTAPCYVTIPSKSGGNVYSYVRLWALPPTNSPSLGARMVTYPGTPVTPVKLPDSYFFDLEKASSP